MWMIMIMINLINMQMLALTIQNLLRICRRCPLIADICIIERFCTLLVCMVAIFLLHCPREPQFLIIEIFLFSNRVFSLDQNLKVKFQ